MFRIRKYDFNYTRRVFMEKLAYGTAGAGALASSWPLLAKTGGISKAYPDEAISIELQTKGKIKTGDFITADNVDHAKHIMDPFLFRQVKEQGRKIKIRKTNVDNVVDMMYSKPFWDATMRGQAAGGAKFNAEGNVSTADGKHWTGGAPFPDPKTALEATINLTLAWGRADLTKYPVRETEINAAGDIDYQYDFCWMELMIQSRSDGQVVRNQTDLLRQQVVWFLSTSDVAGISFLSTWYYDQRKMPDLYGYLPQFRRVRQFPSNQRFEPLVPGATWFLTDAWAAGDPMLTWGDYKVVEIKPALTASYGNWKGGLPNWEKKRHGGPKGNTFFDTEFELAPEVMVVRAKPTGFPRAPAGFKDMWIDLRNSMYCADIRYDRNGKEWVNFETGSGQLSDPDSGKILNYKGTNDPVWSWNYVLSADIQTGRMTQIEHAEKVTGGIENEWNTPAEEVYDKFFSQKALQTFGKI